MTNPNLGEIESKAKRGLPVCAEEILQLVQRVRELEDILLGLVRAKDSVTLGQEKELFAEFMPKARAALGKEPNERA